MINFRLGFEPRRLSSVVAKRLGLRRSWGGPGPSVPLLELYLTANAPRYNFQAFYVLAFHETYALPRQFGSRHVSAISSTKCPEFFSVLSFNRFLLCLCEEPTFGESTFVR
jgi:hypothetical protein